MTLKLIDLQFGLVLQARVHINLFGTEKDAILCDSKRKPETVTNRAFSVDSTIAKSDANTKQHNNMTWETIVLSVFNVQMWFVFNFIKKKYPQTYLILSNFIWLIFRPDFKPLKFMVGEND